MCVFRTIKAMWWRIFLWHSNFENNTAEVTLWIIYSDEGFPHWNSCWDFSGEGFLLTLLRIDILVGGHCQYFIVFGVICQHWYVTATSNDGHGVSNHWPMECLFNTLFGFTTKKKHQRSALLSFCVGNPPVTGGFLHKGKVTRKMFPFDDVIMCTSHTYKFSIRLPITVKPLI